MYEREEEGYHLESCITQSSQKLQLLSNPFGAKEMERYLRMLEMVLIQNQKKNNKEEEGGKRGTWQKFQPRNSNEKGRHTKYHTSCATACYVQETLPCTARA